MAKIAFVLTVLFLAATSAMAQSGTDTAATTPAAAASAGAPAQDADAPDETVSGQGPAEPVIEPSVGSALIERLIEETEADSSLSDSVKQARLEQYRRVLANLEQLESLKQTAATYKSALETGPDEIRALRQAVQEAKALADAPLEPLPEATDVAQIESQLAREQAQAASVEAMIAELDNALDAETSESADVRRRAGEATAELAEIDAALNALPASSDDPRDREARRWLLESRRDALRAELLMLDQQLLSADIRRERAEVRRALKQAELKALKARRAYLENEADRLRRLDAERVSAETAAAERETAAAHPVVKNLVEANRALSDQIGDITAKLDQLDEQQAALEQTTERFEEDFRTAQQRLEAAGLNRALGQVLIDQREQLPALPDLRKAAAERADTIAEHTLSQIMLREELRELEDIDAYLDRLLADLPPAEQAALRPDLEKQAELRRDLLTRALAVEDSYRRGLGEIDFAATQLREVVERYDTFLDERLLWVRSVEPITQQSFAALPGALRWAAAPANWRGVLSVLSFEAPRSPLLWLGLALVGMLLWRGAALRRRVRATAEHLRRVSTDRYGYTLQALTLTLVAALPWPLLLALLGWQIQGSLQADSFAKAVGGAMLAVSPGLYYLRAFRLICMSGGVADRHFRWSSEVLRQLRTSFDSVTWLLLPVGFLAALMFGSGNATFTATLGRIALALLNVGLAVLTAALLHPTRGAVKNLLAARPGGWPSRLRGLWYPLLVAVPLALAALALFGYLYTSGVLLRSLISELWLVLGLVVLHQLIVRWLVLTRRSLALEAALERRRVARQAQHEPEDKGPALLSVEDEPVDLASLDVQTRRLLNTLIFAAAAVGLWLIWSDVLPALNLLERFTLWNYESTVDGVPSTVPVTLADLGLIVVIAALSVAAAKNLPALLEILLLKNTSMTAGGRYTLTTLTGYTITAVGALLVVGTLGLSWGEVQWLVAALGVGIGFGLQEIVANFISGLIILFERPVRVGDIVSIGDTTGVVTKIQIRATTIRNWDKQELLVPNKEFITGRLLNWTLSDQVNRVVITVGVEYGADTRKAMSLLQQAAAEHPRVMTDPEPIITFEGFGDNSLTLVLRFYLDSLDFRLSVITDMHQAIDDKFRAAGIGIAFPQRDIHLRSAEPLEIHLSRAAAASGAGRSAEETSSGGGAHGGNGD